MASQNTNVLIREKYGSTGEEIYYVVPQNQRKVVAVDMKKNNSIFQALKSIFLPQGYPDSVSPDYTSYQVWDTAQAFCSTITGIIATQEVLRSVGVGDTNVTPLAATITWVLKDGAGHCGRIMFAWLQGTSLDSYSKQWRLFADVLNDFATCLELALPLFKGYTTAVLCLSTTMKAIVGVAGGATRAALTQHQALRGNMGDVSAKDSAQETAVNLIGSVVALFVLGLGRGTWLIFALLLCLHIVFNYLAVRSVCLHVFNEPRYLKTIYAYLKHEMALAPCEANAYEPVLFFSGQATLRAYDICGFQIVIGSSLKHFMKSNTKYENHSHMKELIEVYNDDHYMVIPDVAKRKLYIVLDSEAKNVHVLCAYLHAVILAIVTCSINFHPLSVLKKSKQPVSQFQTLCDTIVSADWSRELIAPKKFDKLLPQADGGDDKPIKSFVYTPSTELLRFLNNTVTKEWVQLRRALIKTGWNLDKHLLIADEWRIVCECNKPLGVVDEHECSTPEHLNECECEETCADNLTKTKDT